MSRANSLKKAVRQIIEHTEKTLDEQNAQTRATSHLISPEIRLQPSDDDDDHHHSDEGDIKARYSASGGLQVSYFSKTFCIVMFE